MLFSMNWSLFVPKHGFFITCDNPLLRGVDPSTRHPIYGDHGFANSTAEVIFPLSLQRLLVMCWKDTAPDFGTLEREQVDRINEGLAAQAERYLYAHIHHKKLRALAARYKDVRPGIAVSGFGPERYAEVKVPARRKRT
jgi:Protein of unknown function (DUF4238)